MNTHLNFDTSNLAHNEKLIIQEHENGSLEVQKGYVYPSAVESVYTFVYIFMALLVILVLLSNLAPSDTIPAPTANATTQTVHKPY
jgi:hypothetical protein